MSYLLVENDSSVDYQFVLWQQPGQHTEGWETCFKLIEMEVDKTERVRWVQLDDTGWQDDISGYKLPRSDWSKSTQTATCAAKSRPLDFQATNDDSRPPLNL